MSFSPIFFSEELLEVNPEMDAVASWRCFTVVDFDELPSRKLTNMPYQGDMLIPWRVVPNLSHAFFLEHLNWFHNESI